MRDPESSRKEITYCTAQIDSGEQAIEEGSKPFEKSLVESLRFEMVDESMVL